MTLEEEIQDRLVTKDETILESNLNRVEPLLRLHQDGTISIQSKYRDIEAELQILIYLIGQRFAYEGGLAEEDTLETEFFYEHFNRSDRTVRNDLQNLREEGIITKEGQSKHRLVVENLPDALNRIEGADN